MSTNEDREIIDCPKCSKTDNPGRDPKDKRKRCPRCSGRKTIIVLK